MIAVDERDQTTQLTEVPAGTVVVDSVSADAMWVPLAEQPNDAVFEARDPSGWYRAWTSQDGCVHLNRYHNEPLSEDDDEDADNDQQLVDYIHICDIDDMITRLQAFKVKAREHFGEGWPV